MSNQLICMGIIGMIFTQKKYEEMKKREKDSKKTYEDWVPHM